MLYDMSRRRQQRKAEKAQRHAPERRTVSGVERTDVREVASVERLAYSRTQAAEVLGISRSAFNRRVLPLIETVETEWGKRLIPVDALEQFVADRRRPPRARPATLGRPPAVSREVVQRIQTEHAAGKSLGQIARDLDADHVPTAQRGRRWWPSSVRAVLIRSGALSSA